MIFAPRSVLILKPSSLGDVIQALPVLRLIRQAHPKSSIYWWISSELAPLLENDPDLTGIIRFHRDEWVAPRHWMAWIRCLFWVRHQNFDWVIDLQSLLRSALFSWLAQGALTVGLDDHREGAAAFYDYAIPRPSYGTHAVEWYLEVLKYLKVPVHEGFTWMPEEANLELRSPRAIADDPVLILLNPGARWANKRWPVDSFRALVNLLAAAIPNAQFAILGGQSDIPLGTAIAQACPARCIDLTGKTTLRSMVSWIRKASIMVTNDTGPMHVAAALNKPMVALFGPTDPRRTGPYRQVHRVIRCGLPCSPCMKDSCHHRPELECLKEISPQQVAQNVLAQLLRSD